MSALIQTPTPQGLSLPLLRDDDPRLQTHRLMAFKLANHFHATSRIRLFHQLADVESEALQGLWEAIQTFDSERGMTFDAWAFGRIRNHLIHLKERCCRVRRTGDTFSISAAGEDDEPWDLEGPGRWPDELADIAICAADVRRLWSTLPDRESEVLRLRHWEDQTLEEIGARFGLTRERVRQVYEKAIESLRAKLRRDRAKRTWNASRRNGHERA